MINSKKGLSSYLNLRDTYLFSDFTEATAKPTYYDTDLENFWTQKSFLFFFYLNKIFQQKYIDLL